MSKARLAGLLPRAYVTTASWKCLDQGRIGGARRMSSVWERMWAAGTPPFHLPHVNPNLTRWYDAWTAAAATGAGGAGDASGAAAEGGQRVLVPLCGKTVDLMHLVARGHPVVGIESVDTAVYQLRDEQVPDLQVARPSGEHHKAGADGQRSRECGAGRAGGHAAQQEGASAAGVARPWCRQRYTSAAQPLLTVLVGDFLRVASDEGSMRPDLSDDVDMWPPFPLVWDRGGITSVAPSAASFYLRALRGVTSDGGAVLMETMSSDQSQAHSPEGLAAAAAGVFEVQELATRDARGDYPGSPFSKLDEHVVLLRAVLV